MTDPTVDPAVSAIAVPEPPPLVSAIGAGAPAGKSYRNRFLAVYAVLGLVFVGAVAGGIVLALQSGPLAGPAWSTWKPASGTTAKMTSEIADHVSSQYKLNAAGTQLVAVVPGAPKVTSGTHDVKIFTIAVRKKPQSDVGIQLFGAGSAWTDQFCGLGPDCSIDQGQASEARGRLVRREALEVALYTFKFVPAISSVVAFMPPPPGQTTTPLVFLQKANLKEQLSQPLNKTLSLAKPPLPSEPDNAEKKMIDALTLPAVFSYSLTQLPDGSAALVLDPSSS